MERQDTGTIYTFQRRSLLGLLGWGVGSLAAGLGWMRDQDRCVRSLGMQFAAWGAIDALIALVGRALAGRKAARRAAGQLSPAAERREVRTTDTILRVSIGLDLVYLAAGLVVLGRANNRPDWQGAGWGVLAQGGFLLVFDVASDLALRQMFGDDLG